MNTEVEKRLKKYNENIGKNNHYLEKIKENKKICIDLLDGAIELIKSSSEDNFNGYELKVGNERRKPIEKKEKIKSGSEDDFFFSTESVVKEENIELDIILSKENEDVKVGYINCDIEELVGIYTVEITRYNIHLNTIEIYDEYKKRGFGTYVLQHIPMIISHICEAEIKCITTTPQIFKYDKYEIHDDTYSERVENIKKWLEKNGYEEKLSYLEDENKRMPIFELDKNRVSDFLKEFNNLNEEINKLGFRSQDDKYSREKIIECNKIIEKICDSKYTIGSNKRKVKYIEIIKSDYEENYNVTKEETEDDIKILTKAKKIVENINKEDLTIKEDDIKSDIILKLYLKHLKYTGVIDKLSELGFTTTDRHGKKKNYGSADIKEEIINSESKYVKFKEYAVTIIMANKLI